MVLAVRHGACGVRHGASGPTRARVPALSGRLLVFVEAPSDYHKVPFGGSSLKKISESVIIYYGSGSFLFSNSIMLSK
jgi:hypothetical protein